MKADLGIGQLDLLVMAIALLERGLDDPAFGFGDIGDDSHGFVCPALGLRLTGDRDRSSGDSAPATGQGGLSQDGHDSRSPAPDFRWPLQMGLG
jgi:hypothetical protein